MSALPDRRAAPARLVLRGAGAFVVAGALVCAFSCSSIRQDELECEEAAARLRECCPRVEISRINCDHDNGCGQFGQQHDPDLRGAIATCVHDTSCDAMVRPGGVCDKVRQATFTPEFTGTRDSFQDVCP